MAIESSTSWESFSFFKLLMESQGEDFDLLERRERSGTPVDEAAGVIVGADKVTGPGPCLHCHTEAERRVRGLCQRCVGRSQYRNRQDKLKAQEAKLEELRAKRRAAARRRRQRATTDEPAQSSR